MDLYPPNMVPVGLIPGVGCGPHRAPFMTSKGPVIVACPTLLRHQHGIGYTFKKMAFNLSIHRAKDHRQSAPI